MTRIATIAIILALSAAPSFAGEAPKVTAVPIVKTDKTVLGQPITMPVHPTLIATIGTFPPGSRLPVHKHLYPHYGYMLEGVLTVTNVQTGKSFTVKKGDFLVEMNDTWHYGQNNGTVPVKMLIIDHLPKGVTSNVVLKE